MRGVFFVVGPTATGKSEIAADVATEIGAEIVSADAFQIYRGLDLLTAKPETGTLAKVPHHLIGTVSILDKMSAAKFRERALVAISEIHSRGKLAIVVGGSGLYIKALTHGLSSGPAADPDLRARLNELSLHDLQNKLLALDPEAASKIDLKNRRRLVRAIEVYLLGEQKICALAYALAFAMNVVLCMALVPRFGGHGAAAATSISLTFETVLLFWIVRQRLGLHVLAFGK